MNYQRLVEEAVALFNADRGFVVLCDPATGVLDQYAATHNFDPALLLEQAGEEFTEHDQLREMLPAVFAESEPILTSNAMTDSYYWRKVSITGWVLRCIIAVPLKKGNAGLLWCDKSIRAKGLWMEQDLEQAVALVERFHASS